MSVSVDETLVIQSLGMLNKKRRSRSSNSTIDLTKRTTNHGAPIKANLVSTKSFQSVLDFNGVKNSNNNQNIQNVYTIDCSNSKFLITPGGNNQSNIGNNTKQSRLQKINSNSASQQNCLMKRTQSVNISAYKNIIASNNSNSVNNLKKKKRYFQYSPSQQSISSPNLSRNTFNALESTSILSIIMKLQSNMVSLQQELLKVRSYQKRHDRFFKTNMLSFQTDIKNLKSVVYNSGHHNKDCSNNNNECE
eukprot:TRINITY_DN2593_c0_g1_i1.p1 TRINITY_DN2593_c0_g1~~TRINITY_DN2593_c0_g1_i1.p1  ORF type:complete len:249 (-),score=34.50 TRINITY_DN2593_c0_g1_i1:57-803(-)